MDAELEQPDPAVADPVGVAREIALRLLTVRPRTRAELEAAFAKRKVPADAAAEVLRRFGDVGLIDDAAFARGWVEAGGRRQRGRRALAQELGNKGVARELISEALAERDQEAELAAAVAFARKRAPAMAGLDRQIRYRRLSGALARRGFAADVVLAAVRESLQDVPEDFTDDTGDFTR
jgi:regulatory protein